MANQDEATLDKIKAMQSQVQAAAARFMKWREEELDKAQQHLEDLEKTEHALRTHATSIGMRVAAAHDTWETDSEAYERDAEGYERTLVSMAENRQGQQQMREIIAIGMTGEEVEE